MGSDRLIELADKLGKSVSQAEFYRTQSKRDTIHMLELQKQLEQLIKYHEDKIETAILGLEENKRHGVGGALLVLIDYEYESIMMIESLFEIKETGVIQ